MVCVQGSTNGTNGIPISFKVLPMVPLVIPLVGHSKTNVHFMSLLIFEAKNKTVLSFKANCLFPTFN